MSRTNYEGASQIVAYTLTRLHAYTRFYEVELVWSLAAGRGFNRICSTPDVPVAVRDLLLSTRSRRSRLTWD